MDLNPIRAGIAQTIEDSQFTSAQLRLNELVKTACDENESPAIETAAPTLMPADIAHAPLDRFLAPVEIDELNDPLGPRASVTADRCSDKGFLAMPTADYLELLDWTARQLVVGKRGATPEDAPALFERLKIKPTVWYALVTQFGKLFSLVAGQPHRVDDFRGRRRKKRFYVRQAARQLLTT